MMVFWQKRLAILAVPKTGTTALEKALGPEADIVFRDPPGLKHMTLFRFNRFVAPLMEKGGCPRPETVAVVREPLDWLGSWWRYRQRPDAWISTAGISFDEFVDAWCRSKRPDFADIGTQSAMLKGEGDKIGVDHIFRYDQLGELHAFLEERLERKIEVPPANVSPQMPLELRPGMVQRLKKKGAEEFALWESLGGTPAI
ncbi:gamma-glutamyl kinase [Pseudoroseicyclus sp. CXY001]|uniref:gamma-glutamyl kinase n=1 Tax=Pseudoroseicyclus sp. CXY001 TaxID=3242492 RepID=UPI0035715FE8